MRPADINRAKKCLEHLKAADTLLHSIKWENVSSLESEIIRSLVDNIQVCRWKAEDIIRLGGGEV